MARTMKWPPVPVGGRIPMVEGVDADVVLVVQTLSDLQTQPFNDDALSLGDITYRTSVSAKSRIESAMKRLERIVSLESITEERDEDGTGVTYTVKFSSREARQPAEVKING